jgi:uncharacterized protein YuzE
MKIRKPRKVNWDYDREADTLYVSFGKPQPALTLDLGEGMLARYREEDGELVGFTIIGVSRIVDAR